MYQNTIKKLYQNSIKKDYYIECIEKEIYIMGGNRKIKKIHRKGSANSLSHSSAVNSIYLSREK